MTVFEAFRTVVNDDLDELLHVNNVRYVLKSLKILL